MSLILLPPPCKENAPLAHIFFTLLAKNGPLPAELKFRENTVCLIGKKPGKKAKPILRYLERVKLVSSKNWKPVAFLGSVQT